MKNKMVKGLVMTGMACMLLTACGSKEQADTTQTADTVVTVERTSDEETDVEATQVSEDAVPTAQSVPETKAEDFEYTGLQDGTIKIQRYIGESNEVSIPAQIDGKDVSVLGEVCFGNKDKITSVVIPDTVKEIEDKAFINCSSLVSVKMSANIEVIGVNAFYGELTEVKLPDTLREIGARAFACCDLVQLEIPSSLTTIQRGTFLQNDMEYLVIPGNIKSIGVSAFDDCDFLKEVVLEDGVETLDEYVFAKCDVLEKVTMPASVTEIASNVFYNSNNVTIVAEPGSYAETWAAENDIPCVNP